MGCPCGLVEKRDVSFWLLSGFDSGGAAAEVWNFNADEFFDELNSLTIVLFDCLFIGFAALGFLFFVFFNRFFHYGDFKVCLRVGILMTICLTRRLTSTLRWLLWIHRLKVVKGSTLQFSLFRQLLDKLLAPLVHLVLVSKARRHALSRLQMTLLFPLHLLQLLLVALVHLIPPFDFLFFFLCLFEACDEIFVGFLHEEHLNVQVFEVLGDRGCPAVHILVDLLLLGLGQLEACHCKIRGCGRFIFLEKRLLESFLLGNLACLIVQNSVNFALQFLYLVQLWVESGLSLSLILRLLKLLFLFDLFRDRSLLSLLNFFLGRTRVRYLYPEVVISVIDIIADASVCCRFSLGLWVSLRSRELASRFYYSFEFGAGRFLWLFGQFSQSFGLTSLIF